MTASPLAQVLLLVQAATGGLVLVEEVVLGAVIRSPILLGIGLLSSATAATLVLVAAGLTAGWGWSAPVGLAFELLLLVSGVANGIMLGNNDLVSLLATVAIPIAVIHQLIARYARSEWSGAGSRAGSTRS